MGKLIQFPTWRSNCMNQEMTDEEKKFVNELTIKVINNEPVEKIEKWVRNLPDNIQVLMVETIDVMNKNLDMILKSPNQKEIISKLLKGELDETNSKSF